MDPARGPSPRGVGVYTQCPDCATVFRVTAEALRVAQGDVRCGVCSTTFNALENLSEQAFQAGAGRRGALARRLDDRRGAAGQREHRAVGARRARRRSRPAAGRARRRPQRRSARRRSSAMEFHGDAADLDRLFVVENPEPARFDPAEVAVEPDSKDPGRDLDSTDEHPILVLDERDEQPEVPAAFGEVPVAAIEEEGESIVLETLTPNPVPLPTAPAPRHAGSDWPHGAAHPDSGRDAHAPRGRGRAHARPRRASSRPRKRRNGFLSQRWPWVAGVALLALLFVMQVIHRERNDLVRSPTWGAVVAGAYASSACRCSRLRI